ncbi:hypothetical protein V1477_007782 [Vespula maculifrons]|uniref:Uncharacterized protein n=1 Tax=Vespula maculifrons TaxID=7453 RepID=A0ABD2CFR0_VESMC
MKAREEKAKFLEDLGRSSLVLDHVTSSDLDYCLSLYRVLFKECEKKHKSSRIRQMQKKEDAKVHQMIEKKVTITVKSHSNEYPTVY